MKIPEGHKPRCKCAICKKIKHQADYARGAARARRWERNEQTGNVKTWDPIRNMFTKGNK